MPYKCIKDRNSVIVACDLTKINVCEDIYNIQLAESITNQ